MTMTIAQSDDFRAKHEADTFTVYRVNLNGKLSHKEHLNNVNEMLSWTENAYGKHVTIRVECDQRGTFNILTDNGQCFERIQKGKCDA